MVKVSVPGKIHLIGEHAVVYGEPAILSSIGLRLNVEFSKSQGVKYIDRRWDTENVQEWTVEDVLSTTKQIRELWQLGSNNGDFTPLLNLIKADRYAGYRKSVVGLVLEKLGIKEGVTLSITCDIPTGAGVGSSSALAVAFAAGISELYEKNLSLEKVNEIALELEKVIHGTPSGGDNTTCCYGGLLWFQKGDPRNIMMQLKEEIPTMPEGFVLVNMKGEKTSTGELIQRIRNLDESYRDTRIKEIGKLVYEMKVALKSGKYDMMKEIIIRDQQLLKELEVSTPEIDNVVSAIQKIGGAAKLCGAGGGGVVLCWNNDKEVLKKTIVDLGYEPWETQLGVEGVRIEK